MAQEISIRPLEKRDILFVSNAFADTGWVRPAGLYERYLNEQNLGMRTVLLGFFDGYFTGHVTVNWKADYLPFRERGIPLIQDLNVLPSFRRRGIATALVDEAERRISEKSDMAGIGVGMHADYGPAQRMYVLRGYVPDGEGLYSLGMKAKPGSMVRVDDDLILYFTKVLRD